MSWLAILKALRATWHVVAHHLVPAAFIVVVGIFAFRSVWHHGEPVERGRSKPTYEAPETETTSKAPKHRVHTTIRVPKLSPQQLAAAQEKFGKDIQAPVIKPATPGDGASDVTGTIFDSKGTVVDLAGTLEQQRKGPVLLGSHEVKDCRWGCEAGILLKPDDSFGLRVTPFGRPKREWFPAIEAGGFIDALDPNRIKAHLRVEIRRDKSWRLAAQPYAERKHDGQVDRGVWVGEVWRKERD